MNILFQKKIQRWWQRTLAFQQSGQERLKANWRKLNSREQDILQAGAIISAVLLSYLLIWMPLNTQLEYLRTQIQAEKKALAWILKADKQIRALDNSKDLATDKLRLNSIQDELLHSPLSENISQLTQNGTAELHCVFDSVDFDKLSSWLITFSQQHQLNIRQTSVRSLNQAGLVQAEFVFLLD